MTARSRTQLVLFDIDGTLLLSGGAGKRALNRAFKESFGVDDGFDSIPVAGRTDALILRDALDRSGVVATDSCRVGFFTRYYEYLEQEIIYPGRNKGLMPGVSLLLERLVPLPDVVTGLLTGNFARAAKIKLQYFGIWDYFVLGAYGDDAPLRDDLVPIAVSRARANNFLIVSSADTIVVGDTPLVELDGFESFGDPILYEPKVRGDVFEHGRAGVRLYAVTRTSQHLVQWHSCHLAR